LAFEFTGNSERYGQAMRKVIVAWPISCEHNLTEPTMNRLAWIGHAACSYEIDCPEDVTRQAWGMLTEKQRIDADAQAQKALDEWISGYKGPGQEIHQELGEARLPRWNTRRSRSEAGRVKQSPIVQKYLPCFA